MIGAWGYATWSAARALWKSLCWHRWKPHYKWMPERWGFIFLGPAFRQPAGNVRIGRRCAKCGKVTTKDWGDRVLSATNWSIIAATLLFIATLLVFLAREFGPDAWRWFVCAWTGCSP